MAPRDTPDPSAAAPQPKVARATAAVDGLDAAGARRRPAGLGAMLQRSWLPQRGLVVIALLGCLGLFLLARLLAQQPYIDATWRVESVEVVELVSSPLPALRLNWLISCPEVTPASVIRSAALSKVAK